MFQLIVNPVAGNGLAKHIGEEAAKRLADKGIPFDFHLTDHPGHATELAQLAAQAGHETVVAFGGDGTVTETAAGLRGTRTALGIVPAGTGNDFIKTVALPKQWDEALDFILTHPPRPVNTGMMNDRFFMNVCGAGFDVMVLDFAESAKKKVRGIWPYLYGVLRSIGNGRFIGGGIPITPLADVTDGLFDVLVVDAVPRWKIPFYLPSLMLGKLHQHAIAHRYLASTCTLSSPHMRLNLDGEILPIESAHFVCETDALLLHW